MSNTKDKNRLRAVARVSPEMRDQLESIAGQMGVTVSDVIRMGMNDFIPRWEAGKVQLHKFKAA